MSNKNSNKSPGSYKAIKLLGEGSYGKAYLVENLNDGSQCVIKTIPISDLNEEEKKETCKEATILQRLDHSNIIKFIEVFISKKPKTSLNIVTEYADGGDLGEKIKAQPKGKYFPESQVLDWFTQICLAIKHIHDKHIIHRDLKAQNIFLTKSGLIKLGDFGIAKTLKNTWENARTMVGTPYYLSPEIVQGKDYSFKSDIWSLGVLLYQLMSLRMPFDANNLPMLSLKIMKGQYAPLPLSYTADLRALVGKLLCVDPTNRLSVKEILSKT